jgi:hypothetical protein
MVDFEEKGGRVCVERVQGGCLVSMLLFRQGDAIWPGATVSCVHCLWHVIAETTQPSLSLPTTSNRTSRFYGSYVIPANVHREVCLPTRFLYAILFLTSCCRGLIVPA